MEGFFMERSEKLEQRSRNCGRKFFASLHKKAFVPLGCILAGIRYVTRLARMKNYAVRLVPCGLLCQNSNVIVK